MKKPKGYGETVITANLEIKQFFGSLTTSYPKRKSKVTYYPSEIWYAVFVNGKEIGPRFQAEKGKVVATHGGTLDSYQEPIAKLLKSTPK